MKKFAKSMLAVILVVIMLLTTVSVAVFATGDTDANVETDVTASGTGSIGGIVSDTIQQVQLATQADGAAVITELTLKNLKAHVVFSTNVAAKLVVAVYTDDGEQILTSGIRNVSADATEADVDLSNASLPQYYLLKAFLLDINNNSALCEPYTSIEHTKAFAEFLAKTTDDFDENLVINFDNSEKNNFAVLNDGATVVEEESAKNNLISADEANGIYVFGDIDDSIRNIKSGDIFCYKTKDLSQIIAIKVGSVSIAGNTATIKNADASIEQIFDYVKIDASKAETELTTAAQADPWIDYDSLTQLESTHNILEKTMGGAKLTGTADVDTFVDFKIYIQKNLFTQNNNNDVYVRFKVNPIVKLTVLLTGEFESSIPLKSIGKRFFGVVDISVSVTLVIKSSAKIELTGHLVFSVGTEWSSGSGFRNLSEKPQFRPEVKAEGDIYIGVEIEPALSLIHEKFLLIGLIGEEGVTVSAKLSEDNEKECHACEVCFEGKLTGHHKVTAYLIFARGTFIKYEPEKELDNLSYHIADFYWSVTYNEFDFGKCPHAKHSYTSVVTPPTCTVDGFTTHTCKYCGDTYKDNVTSAAGHIDSEWITTVEPSCTSEGKAVLYCKVCKKAIDEKSLPQSHHGDVTRVVEPTCEYLGYTEHFCFDCGKTYIDNKVLALGHVRGKLIESVVQTQPDPGSGFLLEGDGISFAYETYECSRCGHLFDDYISYPHQHYELTGDGKKVCLLEYEYLDEKEGHAHVIWSFCDNINWVVWCRCCNVYLKIAPGHKWHTEDGIYKCSICGLMFTYTHVTGKFNITYFETVDSARTLSTAAELCVLHTAASSTEKTVSFADAKPGTGYILLNVTGYSESFTLTAENLLYIDYVTADKNGKIDKAFIPRTNAENSTTLLIGNFGSGIAPVRASKIEIETAPSVTSYNYKAGTSTNGLKVIATLIDGSRVDVTNEVTVTDFDTSSIGTKTATVEFEGQKATFEYTVSYAWWQWIIRILLLGFLWY